MRFRHWIWLAVVPSASVIAVGLAFLHMRLNLKRAESIAKVQTKVGELHRAALSCLNDVGARLLTERSVLSELPPEAISQELSQNFRSRINCESAVFAISNRELIVSVPAFAASKYPELPISQWGASTADIRGSSALLPVVEGPYENASQEWYVIVRVPYHSTSAAWLASVVPLSLLFNQTRLKEIIDQDVGIRIFDVAQSNRSNLNRQRVALVSLGPGPFSPLIHQELPVGRDALLMEFSPALNRMLWRSALVYGSLILITALSAGVMGYEVSAEQQRLKSEIQRQDRNLRDTRQQLNQVMSETRTVDGLSIGAAYQDVITGLPNWLYFCKHLERSLQRPHHGTSETMTIVLTELDDLPSLQRQLDSGGVDKLLLEVVSRFEARLRPEDLMATRLGQGEFAFLRFNTGNASNDTELLRQLPEALEQPFIINDKTIILSLKSGVANSREFTEAQQLILQAEAELLKTKLKAGRDRTTGDALATPALIEGRDLADVKTAIERDELRLDYLPLIELATRRVIGLEVLVRWHHPFKGTISPSRFIPIAEASGQGVFLTKWVLNQSVQELAGWRRRLSGVEDLFVSVNLTPHEFGRPGLCSVIEVLLEETALPANRLHLELDEEILGGEVKLAVDLSKRLQAMGIKLAFEEFGAAHTALSSLRLVKWNSVKVAKKFGAALSIDPEDQQALRALTHMAQDLGIDCVAKAIETEKAASEFAALGYQFGQGFLFYKPMPASRIEEILKQRSA